MGFPSFEEGLVGYYIGIYIMVFLFGITIGSFLNVCIYRLPVGESLTKKNSHCMTCGTPIKWYDLVPVFSWLFLRGKCRACGEKISGRYILVESLTGILFVLTFLRFDVIVDGLIYPALLCLFIAGLIGMFAVSVPFLIFGFVITPLIYSFNIIDDCKAARKIKKRLKKMSENDKERPKLQKKLDKHLAEIEKNGPVYGFGMGDIILMAAGGLMFGWKAAVVAAFAAIVLGALYAAVLKIKAAHSDSETVKAFAFGPFLTAGLAFASFFGTRLMDLYIDFLTVPAVPPM